MTNRAGVQREYYVESEVAVTWIWQGLVSVYLEAIFILAQ